MICHLINKEVVKQNCIKVLNQLLSSFFTPGLKTKQN